MSVHQFIKEHAVVLRFEGMFPEQLDGVEAHRKRVRGDLGHIVRERSWLNKPLIGDDDWALKARDEIQSMRIENFAHELEELKRRKRKKEIARRLAEGPKDPWRATRHGPLREVILTANSEWFKERVIGVEPFDSDIQEGMFEQVAVEWLKQNFGEDVIHARADRDELAYHIHAVIMPRVEKMVNGAPRRMLEPSKHPLIEDYEKAQDSVGVWFSDIGLVRGERRAAAIRAARASGRTPPPKRRHSRPHEWRRDEEARLALKDQALTARQVDLVESATAAAERDWALEGQERTLKAREEAVRTAEIEAAAREATLAAAAAAERRTLADRAAALARREAALQESEAKIGAREAAADSKEQEADAVIALAEGLADGVLAIDPASDPPTAKKTETAATHPGFAALAARIVKGRTTVKRALVAFQRAFATLRRRADEQAQERVREQTEEIRRADDQIVKIAGLLPANQRSRIGEMRAGLVGSITRLSRLIERPDSAGRRQGPDQDGEP